MHGGTVRQGAEVDRQGHDKRKYDADKRRGFLESALEEDETALQAMLALGLRPTDKPSNRGPRIGAPRSLLEAVHEACPVYAADVPYTLGAIAYAEGEYDAALTWFDRFSGGNTSQDGHTPPGGQTRSPG